MTAVLRACALFAALTVAAPGSLAAEAVANVLGEAVTRGELEVAGDAAARIARLRDRVWERVYAHFIAEHGLAATAGEIAEFLAYHREFERRDRLQRSRKLEELKGRLAAGDLAVDERARLEEFRRVLTRMAARDAESEASPPEADGEPGLYRPVIEFWKANRALYRTYGGTVAATRAGPAAHGARVALITEYERRGLVEFTDPRVREALYELISRPPGTVIPAERVDFTPYWKLPIPASYFPE